MSLGEEYVFNMLLRAQAQLDAFDQAQDRLGALGRGMEELAALAARVGPALEAVATGVGIIGAGMASAVSQAAQFDQMLVRIQNNTTMTSADVRVMHDTILRLGSETGQSFDQLALGFMHTTNLGFSAADSIKVLSAANESAVATGAQLEQTANILAQVLHEFGASADEAAHYMGVLHLAAAQGNMTLQQLDEAGGRVFAWAANLHIPFEDAAAGMETMTRHGFTAAQAGTQMVNLFEHMVAPSAAARKELEALGKAAGVDLVDEFTTTVVAQKSYIGVIADTQAAMDKLGLSTEEQARRWLQIIPNLRGSAAALLFTGSAHKDLADAIETLHNQELTGNVTQQTYERMLAQTGTQLESVHRSVQATAIAVGEVFLPVVVAGATALGAFAREIESLVVPALGHMAEGVQYVYDLWSEFGQLLEAHGTKGIYAVPGMGSVARLSEGIQSVIGYKPPALPGSGPSTPQDALVVQARAEIANAQARAQEGAAGRASALAARDALAEQRDQLALARLDERDMARQEPDIKARYEPQIKALQQDLETARGVKDAADAQAHAAEAAIKQYYGDQLTPLREQLTAKQALVDAANAHADVELSRIKGAYEAQVEPLQRQLDAMRAQYQEADRMAALQDRIAAIKDRQAIIDAEGDPARRAALTAQLYTAEHQRHVVDAQRNLHRIEAALGGRAPRTAEAAAVEAEAQAKLAMLQLEDPGKMAAARAAQVVHGATAAQHQLTADLHAADEAPLLAAIAAARRAYEDAVKPIQDGIDKRNRELSILKNELEPQIRLLEQAQTDALRPIQDGIGLRNEEFRLLDTKTKQAIIALQQQEEAELKPIQDQLEALRKQNDQRQFAIDKAKALNDVLKIQADLEKQGPQPPYPGALPPVYGGPTVRAPEAAGGRGDMPDSRPPTQAARIGAAEESAGAMLANAFWTVLAAFGITRQGATGSSGTGGGAPPAMAAGGAGVNDAYPRKHASEWLARAEGMRGNQDYNGWCEMFVEQMAGLPVMGGTALDAWTAWAAQGRGKAGQYPQVPGDLVYFRYGKTGHVGFYAGAGQFISALDDGVREMSMSEYAQYNEAPYLGYVPAYRFGTTFHGGGMALVGEDGPEVLSLPTGSGVTPLGQVAGSTGTLNVNINLSGAVSVSGDTANALGPDFAGDLRDAISGVFVQVESRYRNATRRAPATVPGALRVR